MGSKNKRGLTQQQDAAINLLATGRSIKEAAAVLGLSRNTLGRWIKNNAAFQAALNQRREEFGKGREALDDTVREE